MPEPPKVTQPLATRGSQPLFGPPSPPTRPPPSNAVPCPPPFPLTPLHRPPLHPPPPATCSQFASPPPPSLCQGIRSLSTLMATTAGLKLGGLSTSSGGLASMSTTGRYDGLAGFEGCLSSAHAGVGLASCVAWGPGHNGDGHLRRGPALPITSCEATAPPSHPPRRACRLELPRPHTGIRRQPGRPHAAGARGRPHGGTHNQGQHGAGGGRIDQQ